MQRVVLDTNVFVAAGFNERSASARLVEAVSNGELDLIWDEETRREIEHVVRKIPRLKNSVLDGLFRDEHRFDGETHPEAYGQVPDPADRKFAALGAAADAILITQDDHLLGERDSLDVEVLRPSEAAEQLPTRCRSSRPGRSTGEW